MLFAIHNINATLERILEILEEESGGGTEVPEEDA
jgi:hypothetical protein